MLLHEMKRNVTIRNETKYKYTQWNEIARNETAKRNGETKRKVSHEQKATKLYKTIRNDKKQYEMKQKQKQNCTILKE